MVHSQILLQIYFKATEINELLRWISFLLFQTSVLISWKFLKCMSSLHWYCSSRPLIIFWPETFVGQGNSKQLQRFKMAIRSLKREIREKTAHISEGSPLFCLHTNEIIADLDYSSHIQHSIIVEFNHIYQSFFYTYILLVHYCILKIVY